MKTAKISEGAKAFILLGVFCLCSLIWLAIRPIPTSNFNWDAYQAAQARVNQKAEILTEVHRQDIEHTAHLIRGY
jgi:hypothetical protein